MAKRTVQVGTTGHIEYVFIGNSSVTTGAGLTGLAYNTSGLTAYYCNEAGSSTSITLATQTATGSYSSGGFVQIDATNMAGVYRFDIPNAVFASGSKSIVCIQATGAVPTLLEYDLVSYNPLDATSLGLSAVQSNLVQISGNTTDVSNMAKALSRITPVTVQSGSSSTVINTNLTNTSTGFYQGLILYFVTGTLAGQATNVTAYNGSTYALTVTALTSAPSTGDTAILV